MIEYDITDEMIEKAKKKDVEMGKLRNSIRNGEGNLVGFIGEEVFAAYYNAQSANTYDYDVLYGNLRIDVKTKTTTVKPQPHYFATVADYNTKQNCDLYYFVRVDLNKKKAYLLGGIRKEKFYSESTFYKRGDPDPSSNLGWTFKADCYNLEISKLKLPKPTTYGLNLV